MKWFGWSGGSQVGTLSSTLAGSGGVTIDFGNCWTAGVVKVYLNDVEKGEAHVGTKSNVITFSYADGDELKIKDEGQNSVISSNSIKFGPTGIIRLSHFTYKGVIYFYQIVV